MNRRLSVMVAWIVPALAWPGPSPALTTAAPVITKLRATQVGDSDWVRLDWSVQNPQATAVDAPGNPDLYEIRRTDLKGGAEPLGAKVIGVASARPDVRVFVDKQTKGKDADTEYLYEVYPKSASGYGACASVRVRLKAGPPHRAVLRHLDFDDGRLHIPKDEEFTSVLHPANSAVKHPWTLKDGRLDWLATNANAYSTSRLEIGPKMDGIQITARLAIMGDLPPADCDSPGVGVGIMAANDTRIVSLVLRKSGDDPDKVSIHFLHETLAKKGGVPEGTPLPNPVGTEDKVVVFDLPGRDRSAPDKLTWIWLKVTVATVDGKGEFRGKAWLDAASEPPGWVVLNKSFKNDGWNNARAVLIGGSGDTRATFGEVFIEGTPTSPPATVANRGETNDQAADEADAPPPPVKPSEEGLAARTRRGRLSAVPFEGLPTVIRLVPRASMRPDERDQVEDGRPRLGSDDDPALHFDFAAPAHFPIPRFGGCDDFLDDEGVLIYEGMRLDVASDGRYEVRFIATTPAMPVTLRLQLSLHQRDNSERTVTIPPIEIPPYKNSRGEYERATWKIRHQGYSYNLATRPTPQVRDSNDLDQFPVDGKAGIRDDNYQFVQRAGTARFGSYPLASN
jgi:hypothetical protein